MVVKVCEDLKGLTENYKCFFILFKEFYVGSMYKHFLLHSNSCMNDKYGANVTYY